MSTHVLLILKKYMPVSLRQCCAGNMLMDACFWSSSHCIHVYKFVSVSMELNQY